MMIGSYRPRLSTSISRSSPVIDEHRALILTIPPSSPRRIVHIFKPLFELRWDVENRRRQVSAVGHELAHDRNRRRTWRFHFAHDTAGLEAELCVEFQRELLHARVSGEANHVQLLDLPVAGREQHALEQRRSRAAALPPPLDAQGRLGFARMLKQAQLGRTASHAIDKKTVDDHSVERGGLGIPPDELVGNRAAEPTAPTFGIEAQQMLAVKLGFADPQLADSTPGYERLIHWVS